MLRPPFHVRSTKLPYSIFPVFLHNLPFTVYPVPIPVFFRCYVTVKVLNHYTYYIKIPHEICSDNCKIILHVSWGIFLNVKFGKYSKINYQTNILHFQQPGFTFSLYKKIQDCKVFYIYLTFFSPETLHSPLILVL